MRVVGPGNTVLALVKALLKGSHRNRLRFARSAVVPSPPIQQNGIDSALSSVGVVGLQNTGPATNTTTKAVHSDVPRRILSLLQLVRSVARISPRKRAIHPAVGVAHVLAVQRGSRKPTSVPTTQRGAVDIFPTTALPGSEPSAKPASAIASVSNAASHPRTLARRLMSIT